MIKAINKDKPTGSDGRSQRLTGATVRAGASMGTRRNLSREDLKAEHDPVVFSYGSEVFREVREVLEDKTDRDAYNKANILVRALGLGQYNRETPYYKNSQEQFSAFTRLTTYSRTKVRNLIESAKQGSVQLDNFSKNNLLKLVIAHLVNPAARYDEIRELRRGNNLANLALAVKNNTKYQAEV